VGDDLGRNDATFWRTPELTGGGGGGGGSVNIQVEAENCAVMSGRADRGLHRRRPERRLDRQPTTGSSGRQRADQRHLHVQYRVASQNGGGVIQLEKAGGSPVYGSVGVPSTGGWQNWTTVSHQVNLTAGQQQIAVKAVVGRLQHQLAEARSLIRRTT
jgi:hypothetical protein